MTHTGVEYFQGLSNVGTAERYSVNEMIAMITDELGTNVVDEPRNRAKYTRWNSGFSWCWIRTQHIWCWERNQQ